MSPSSVNRDGSNGAAFTNLAGNRTDVGSTSNLHPALIKPSTAEGAAANPRTGNLAKEYMELNPSPHPSPDSKDDGTTPGSEASEYNKRKPADVENDHPDQSADNNNLTEKAKQELFDYLSELARKYGMDIRDILKLLGLDEEDFRNQLKEAGLEPNGGKGDGNRAPSFTGGSFNPSGGGSDPSGGSSQSTKPESPQQASSLDGKVKFYAENKVDAQKMKNTFDSLYSSDPDFKANIDKLVSQHGELNISAKDFGGNPLGLGDKPGNNFALDLNALTNKVVMAHEMLHNIGWDHGPDMDAEVRKNSDGR